jgi:aminoglycoside phosphotransferase (APT) family kinase protein
MNPKTTLSPEDIAKICSAHGITFANTKRITTGFTNEVHLINDSIILKVCVRSDNAHRMELEARLLEGSYDFSKPKFIGKDFSNTIIPVPYILMEFMHGVSLGSIWHTLSNDTREGLVKDICRNLKVINQIEVKAVLPAAGRWSQVLFQNFTRESQMALESKAVDAGVVTSIKDIITAHKEILDSGTIATVFWDIHLDNFIVSNKGELLALIDLESVDAAPIDYPLVVLENIVSSPVRYLSEEDEQFANENDYEHLISWYQEYYPEMFGYRHHGERLAIYHMLDAIHLLKDWPNSEWAKNELREFLGKFD